METRHPVDGYFERSVIIAELWRPEVARPRNFVNSFFAFFFGKTSYVNFFKILVGKFSPPHRSTLFCSNFVKCCRREIGEIVRYLPDQKKFRPPLKLSLLRGSRQKYARTSLQQPPTNGRCSTFHPNQFTSGGVIYPNA